MHASPEVLTVQRSGSLYEGWWLATFESSQTLTVLSVRVSTNKEELGLRLSALETSTGIDWSE